MLNQLILRSLRLYGRVCHWFYYRRVVVIGRENIPERGPMVFSPNHQNALMDALAVIFSCGFHPLFLSRADIFNQGLANRFLRFIRILPVYRLRDGRNRLEENELIFSQARLTLQSGEALALFPEGTHSESIRLLPLKKGMARILFQTLQESGREKSIPVIPTGIHYSAIDQPFGELMIIYGKPVHARLDAGKDQAVGPQLIATFMQELEKRMLPEMCSIPESMDYGLVSDSLDWLAALYQGNSLLPGKAITFKEFTSSRHQVLNALIAWHQINPVECREWLLSWREEFQSLETLGVMKPAHLHWIHRGKPGLRLVINSLTCLLISIPGTIGLLLFLPADRLMQWFLRKYVGDWRFHSSFRFGSTALLAPFYFALAGYLFHLGAGTVPGLLLMASMPWIGRLRFYFKDLLVQTLTGFRLLRKNQNPGFHAIRKKLQMERARPSLPFLT